MKNFNYNISMFIVILCNLVTSISSKASEISYVVESTYEIDKEYKGDTIGFLVPIKHYNHNLILTDLSISVNSHSKKYSFGLIHRQLVQDKHIFGIYGYLDHYHHDLDVSQIVNQWTLGAEILTAYYDVRLNIYFPQNNVQSTFRKGYDLKVGIPVFSLMPVIQQKYGTKFSINKYSFFKKGVEDHKGIRLQFEQNIFSYCSSSSYSTFKLFAGVDRNIFKQYNLFASLKLRIAFGKNLSNYYRKSNIHNKMTDGINRKIKIIPNIKTKNQEACLANSCYSNTTAEANYVPDQKTAYQKTKLNKKASVKRKFTNSTTYPEKLNINYSKLALTIEQAKKNIKQSTNQGPIKQLFFTMKKNNETSFVNKFKKKLLGSKLRNKKNKPFLVHGKKPILQRKLEQKTAIQQKRMQQTKISKSPVTTKKNHKTLFFENEFKNLPAYLQNYSNNNDNNMTNLRKKIQQKRDTLEKKYSKK